MPFKQDLYIELDQAACDKLVNSVSYPLTILEQSNPFPGCPNLALLDNGYYVYTDEEVDKLFQSSLEAVLGKNKAKRSPVQNQIVAFGGSIIEQAKKAIDASESKEYEGPARADLEKLVNEGMPRLTNNVRKLFGDFGVYAWCPHLKVVLKRKPNISINSPRTDLKQLKVEATATGELWFKYPWFNCYQWCFKWVKVEKCDRIASLTVSVDVAADAHLDFATSGATIVAKPVFDRLRLDYDILDKIPLEGIANDALKSEQVKIFDASLLVTTIPIFNTRFQVDSIALPKKTGAVGMAASIKQI